MVEAKLRLVPVHSGRDNEGYQDQQRSKRKTCTCRQTFQLANVTTSHN